MVEDPTTWQSLSQIPMLVTRSRDNPCAIFLQFSIFSIRAIFSLVEYHHNSTNLISSCAIMNLLGVVEPDYTRYYETRTPKSLCCLSLRSNKATSAPRVIPTTKSLAHSEPRKIRELNHSHCSHTTIKTINQVPLVDEDLIFPLEL